MKSRETRLGILTTICEHNKMYTLAQEIRVPKSTFGNYELGSVVNPDGNATVAVGFISNIGITHITVTYFEPRLWTDRPEHFVIRHSMEHDEVMERFSNTITLNPSVIDKWILLLLDRNPHG